jgi:O-methyltransferase
VADGPGQIAFLAEQFCRQQEIIMRTSSALVSLLKDFSLKTGILRRTCFGIYPYMFTPRQLFFLTDCVRATRDVPGCLVEAGCAFGATTVFLNKFLQEENIRKPYIAIDTFSGFVPRQVEYEISERHNDLKDLRDLFSNNRRSWFEQSVSMAGITNVRSVCCDVTEFNFTSLEAIALCLVDLDLYLPIIDILPKIYAQLSPGGIIVVDDCKRGPWDGALQAYTEFCAEKGIRPEVRCAKLGLIRR